MLFVYVVRSFCKMKRKSTNKWNALKIFVIGLILFCFMRCVAFALHFIFDQINEVSEKTSFDVFFFYLF